MPAIPAFRSLPPALRLALPVLALVTAAASACSRSQDDGKIPLAQATGASAGASTESSPRDALPPAARSAIDSGNAQYRGGRFKEALASYRSAAKAAPDNASPYFGIYMAAQKLGDQKLADSASKEINKLSGNPMLNDSSLRAVHKGN